MSIPSIAPQFGMYSRSHSGFNVNRADETVTRALKEADAYGFDDGLGVSTRERDGGIEVSIGREGEDPLAQKTAGGFSDLAATVKTLVASLGALV